MTNLLKKAKGFTLIEIVLVLAIAGLLMVIVFLALSGAEKSQRDTQRKNALGQIAAGLENYASNNSGQYPASSAAFDTAFATGGAYNNPNWKDPLSDTGFTFNGTNNPTAVISSSTSAQVTYTLSGRTYTVCISLEQGSFTCRTNQ